MVLSCSLDQTEGDKQAKNYNQDPRDLMKSVGFLTPKNLRSSDQKTVDKRFFLCPAADKEQNAGNDHYDAPKDVHRFL